MQKVKVMSQNGNFVEVLAMLDSGSNTSLLSKSAAGRLGLRASLCKILISSFTHEMDFAHNFSVDSFNKYITNMKLDWRN